MQTAGLTQEKPEGDDASDEEVRDRTSAMWKLVRAVMEAAIYSTGIAADLHSQTMSPVAAEEQLQWAQ